MFGDCNGHVVKRTHVAKLFLNTAIERARPLEQLHRRRVLHAEVTGSSMVGFWERRCCTERTVALQ